MKTSTFVIAALFASVQADAPPYFNEPPFAVSTHPAAAGLIQLQSACANSGISGVTCGPSDEELFATGMNGDEDLGEDITMKGDKFHFVQNVQLSAEPAAEVAAPAKEAAAAPAKEAAAAPAKEAAAAPAKDAAAAPAKEAAAAPAKEEAAAPAKKEAIAPAKEAAAASTEEKAPVPAGTAASGAGEAEKKGKVIYDTKGYGPVEKISFFDPKIAKAHTSFYAQANGIPKTESADTFTGVKNFPYPGPEQVHTLDPKIAKGHNTFYNK